MVMGGYLILLSLGRMGRNPGKCYGWEFQNRENIQNGTWHKIHSQWLAARQMNVLHYLGITHSEKRWRCEYITNCRVRSVS